MIIEQDAYREFTRIQIDGHVNLEFVSDNYEQCSIQDVSLAGMFIQGDFNQLECNHCTMDLMSNGNTSGVNLQGLAKVVRQNEDGVAIQFISMDRISYISLQTLLLTGTENPVMGEMLVIEECPFDVTDDFPIPSVLTDYNIQA